MTIADYGLPRYLTIDCVSRWFPDADPAHHKPWSWDKLLEDRAVAFRVHQVGTAVIFLVNLSWMVWGSTRYEVANGIGSIYQGSCNTTKQLDQWLHLAINVLSTLLMGSSNFCMQVLAAPTREEIDSAHAMHKWLDIGTPSIRNLWWIDKRRVACWFLLGFSSVFLGIVCGFLV